MATEEGAARRLRDFCCSVGAVLAQVRRTWAPWMGVALPLGWAPRLVELGKGGLTR